MKNMVDVSMVGADVRASIELLKENYTELEQYANIMEKVTAGDISADVDFQREFNYFYKVRRNSEWRTAFYSLFEECKAITPLTFEYVLRTLYERTGTVEVSFSSKLLATLNPDMPIWDSIVLSRLNLSPSAAGSKEKRLESNINKYQGIVNWYQSFLKTSKAQEFLSAFDSAFPEFAAITAVKKIDFWLWGGNGQMNVDSVNTVENEYLLYSHYGVKKSYSGAEIIWWTARKSFLDFCRRPSFQKRVGIKGRDTLDREGYQLLVDMIPSLLEIASNSGDNQEAFDNKHREICEEIIRLYSDLGQLTYGIAQQWLNLTLANLAVIEANMKTSYWPIDAARKYFHVTVEKYLLEAATREMPNRFQHALGLKCAPLRHDAPDSYEMEWFVPGDTQPVEDWGYSEYMEFQLAVRERLKELIAEKTYQDRLDWAFKAFLEVSQARNR